MFAVLYASLTAVPETPDLPETSSSMSFWQSAIYVGQASGVSRIP